MSVPQRLLDGYRQFRAERFAAEAARYRRLAAGQRPRTMVIGCADSRVDPATIFAAGPGELFVVRNVAALVPPCEEHGSYHGTSAAIEFAVTGLGVSDIVVLGHGLCGGVSAALAAADDKPVGRFVGPWVAMLDSARDEVLAETGEAPPEARQLALEQAAIRTSLANLATFPFVAEAVADGQLQLHGAWFSIAEGALDWLLPGAGRFMRVPE